MGLEGHRNTPEKNTEERNSANCRNPRGFFPNKLWGEFRGGFFGWDFFAAFFLGKSTEERVHPKSTAALRSQNTYCKNCEPSRELQESLGPSGPEIPKKSEKSLPEPPAARPQKVSKKSRTDIFETFSRLFGLFRDFFQTFWGLTAAAPGRLFSDFFFWISGPEGPRDSCSSREGRNARIWPRRNIFLKPLGSSTRAERPDQWNLTSCHEEKHNPIQMESVNLGTACPHQVNSKKRICLAWPSLQSLAVKQKLFFVQILGGEKLLKFVEKCR